MATPLATAFVRIRPDTTGFQAATAKGISRSGLAAQGAKHGKLFGLGFGKSAVRWIGSTIGIVGAAAAVTTVYTAMVNLQRESALVANALKATGGAANVSMGHLTALAGSVSSYSGQGKVAVLQSEKLLLAFTNIANAAGKNNKIYDLSVKAAADLAAATGRDMPSAARMLGKALSDPERGLTALRRAGVVFTAQQTEQIKKMAASGHLMGAQKLILEQLRERYGGAAKAAGDTFGGQMNRLKNLLTGFGVVAMKTILPFLQKALGAFMRLPKSVQAVIVAVGALGLALKVMSASNPVTLIAMAVVALAMVIWKYHKKIMGWFGAAWKFIKASWDLTASQLHRAWSNVINFFHRAWDGMVQGLRNAFAWFVDRILGFFGMIIHGAAAMLGWVPGVGPKLKRAAAAFDQFRRDVNKSLRGINDRTVAVKVKMTDYHFGPGGYATFQAAGGPVRGPGGPKDDKAGLYALSDGEYVISAKGHAAAGTAFLDAVNAGKIIGRAEGGSGVTIQPHVPPESTIRSGLMVTVRELAREFAKTLTRGGTGVVNYARQFVGRVPYVWGGTTPAGWDCSGMTSYVYHRFGLPAPRTSQQQQLWARPSADTPGALAFYYGRGGAASHVGISTGRGQVINAYGTGYGTIISPVGLGGALTGFGVPPGGFVRRFHQGGLITEPVTGVGRSGRRYEFARDEQVTPGHDIRDLTAAVRAMHRDLAAVLRQSPDRTAAGVADALNGAAGRAMHRARYG